MDKKKRLPPFSKMVNEAFEANKNVELNVKMILRFIKENYALEDNKSSLELIYHELEQGRENGKFLKIEANSSLGSFKANPMYMQAIECDTKEPPAYLNPPSPKRCSPVCEATKSEEPKPTNTNKQEQQQLAFRGTILTQSVYKDGKFVTVNADGSVQTGNLDDMDSVFFEVPSMSSVNSSKSAFNNSEVVNNLTKLQEVCVGGPISLISDKLKAAQERFAKSSDDAKKSEKNQKENGKTNESTEIKEIHVVERGALSISGTVTNNDINQQVENQTSNTQNAAPNFSIDSNFQPEVKLLPSDIEVVAILKRRTVSGYVEQLGSQDKTIRRNALNTITEFLYGSASYRHAIVKLGTIPQLVELIRIQTWLESLHAMTCLHILLLKSPEFLQPVLEANITKNLLALASHDYFKKLVLEFKFTSLQIQMANLVLCMTKIFNKEAPELTEIQFNELFYVALESIDSEDERVLRASVTTLFKLFEFKCQYYSKINIPKKKLEQIISLLSSTKFQIPLTRFLREVLHKVPSQIPEMLECGLVGQLIECLECGELTVLILGCLNLIVRLSKEGGMAVLEFVPKMCTFLNSDNEMCRQLATLMFDNMTYRVPLNLLSIHMDPASFDQFHKNINEFNLVDTMKYRRSIFQELGQLICNKRRGPLGLFRQFKECSMCQHCSDKFTK